MRSLLVPALFALLAPHLVACGGGDGDFRFAKPQCSDGLDNDGNGAVDFPDDLSCSSADDNDEDGLVSPQCADGRDNDGDGKADYPLDPGCFAPNQDSEIDECPDGPTCPQCSDGKDNDGNGATDYPDDSGGCDAASDTDEYTRNPAACGSNVMIKMLPFDGHVTGTLGTGASSLTSPMCGGAGFEDVYELRIASPKVIVATTNNSGTTADTVLYIRGQNCASGDSEIACSDDIDTSTTTSSITQSIATPGTYYLVVDAHDATSGGAYELTVKFLTGEGEMCDGADDCGPGLVCRTFNNSPTKVCAKHVCEDGVDDDGDGKTDYPNDPGCERPDDEDETDGCPGVGPDCPECGDGVDNDMDGMADYGSGGDTTCTSASGASEACESADGVTALTTGTVMGTTMGAANDINLPCGSSFTQTAPDTFFRLDVPAMASLTIKANTSFDSAVALYDATCGGTALSCVEEEVLSPEVLTLTNLAAGTYYYVLDGYSSGSGTYTLTVSGTIKNGESCESELATSGAITCAPGYTCAGAMGSRTCQRAQCLDGIDNDMDGKADYPFDPGCESANDPDETDPATPPVCSNGTDDDGDNLTDYPDDFGCASAGGSSEVFCTGEMDPIAVITTKTTTGTTTGKANDFEASCPPSSAAPDVTFALVLPVPVATLTLDTNGSQFDTALVVRDTQCSAELFCDDDGGDSTQSKLTLSNVAPGSYAVIVDAYSSNNGPFTLNVQGTVAPGTPCDSPLFTGGANAVLLCPANTTCTGTPKTCQ